MNAAVGKNAPVWLCIESIDFTTQDTDSLRSPYRQKPDGETLPTYPAGWVSPVAASRAVRRAKETVYKWIKSGVVESRKNNRQTGLMVRLDDVIDYDRRSA